RARPRPRGVVRHDPRDDPRDLHRPHPLRRDRALGAKEGRRSTRGRGGAAVAEPGRGDVRRWNVMTQELLCIGRRGLATIALAISLTGCLVGPDYKRPETGPPANFRFASDELERTSVADLKWFELFQDEALRELIQTALQQNYDLEIAAARVLQVQAQVGIVRSQIFPMITGAGSGQTLRLAQNRSSGLPPGVNPVVTFGTLSLGMTWEIDVW